MARPKPLEPPPPSSTVRARLMGLGGTRSDGKPDTSAIARRVGRSPRTVQRWLASGVLPAEAEKKVRELERDDARKPKWISANDEGVTGKALFGRSSGALPAVQDVKGSLLVAFQRPDGSVDTRRAASELGVSQRTVQRWVAGASRPKIDHQASLRSAVRVSMVQSKRGSRQRNLGASISLTAVVQISGDMRRRTLGHQSGIKLSGDQMARIQEAYVRGGDAAADRELSRAVASSTYGRNCGMDSGSIRSISEVSFRRAK